MMRRLIQIVENAQSEVLYHGSTDQLDITKAQPLTHFGSWAAAAHRIHTKRAEQTDGRPRHLTVGYIYPVMLNIQNPLVINDEAGLTHSPYKLTDMLRYDLKAITADERNEIMKTGCRAEKIVEVLRRHGYDGMVYTNAVEDKGHRSYVIFDPAQIKPVAPPETYVSHGGRPVN